MKQVQTSPALQPGVVVVLIERKWIEAGVVGPAIELLAPMVHDRASVEAHAGTLMTLFEDWESDPRDLWDIPQVRHWFKELTVQFPYWAVLCEREEWTLALVINLLAAGVPERPPQAGKPLRRYGAATISNVLASLFQGLDVLCARCAIPCDVADKWCSEISVALDRQVS